MSEPVVKLRHRIIPILAAIAVITGLVLLSWHGYRAVLAQPVKRVVFAGDLDRLPHADLEALSQAIQRAERPTLEAVREAAKRVPWVRDASVRRRFPDAVEIRFQAHEALARWNERSLVSPAGEVFVADDARDLPLFRGAEGAATAMAAEYPALVAALAPLGSPVKELRLSPRGAWEARLANGLAIQLGRGDWQPRVQRFVSVWGRLPEPARATRHADLRYPNGFALRATASK
ncbi:MAG TPA: cell division protein FtsQ/DivIB [Usitatibacter sp.]|nr:cell division protein FtsQ/DivIB [Usitatibacter sp.]